MPEQISSPPNDWETELAATGATPERERYTPEMLAQVDVNSQDRETYVLAGADADILTYVGEQVALALDPSLDPGTLELTPDRELRPRVFAVTLTHRRPGGSPPETPPVPVLLVQNRNARGDLGYTERLLPAINEALMRTEAQP